MRKWVYGILGILMLSFMACSSSDDDRVVIPNDVVGWWELDHYNTTILNADNLDTLDCYDITEQYFKFILNADGTAQNYGDKGIYHYTITKDSFIFEGIKSAIEVKTPTFMRVRQTYPIQYNNRYKRNCFAITRSFFVKIDK